MEFFPRTHCKYTGIKGFISVANLAFKDQYMITEEANFRVKVLEFWKKYGLEATMDAYHLKRRTLFLWKKKLREGKGKLESLNPQSRARKRKRKRLWPLHVLGEIQKLREEHPNLGKDKIFPLLQEFCIRKGLQCPSSSTIGRLIADMGGLRTFPQKISHFGKIKKKNRQKVLRKPKDFKAVYPGHLVGLDTIERIIDGCRRYVITFEDIFSRFAFAWATSSHASRAAEEFFGMCRIVFPCPITFVLTDNGSEFKKEFSKKLKELHLLHYHTYPKTPKMNAHVERFNRTIQEEFINYHSHLLLDPNSFNPKLIEWLIWYNTKRPHFAFKNHRSPLQFLVSSSRPQECNFRWTHTLS
ncbi:transposase [Candidatus Peregrinibacteria bacterium]|nr:transposase [Candidatus Peregrinibacteria bacterium]